PAEQPVDTAPKVVSRRRRAAARPAGPPAGAPTDDQGAQPVPADEPIAGPGEDPATPDTPTTDSETADDPGSGSLVHVPVKKKGSRKR
ncbi:MAG TPA: hypothetical protein VFK34_05550, partial [Marmoricola sp.]|nr:hypothetical protein [Marmoricola sp.]